MAGNNLEPEIRYRAVNHYVNDSCSYPIKVPEAIFAFTLEEIEALESWVPWNDSFHKEVWKAKERLKQFKKEQEQRKAV